MAPEQQSEIIQHLENSRREFHAAAQGLADAEAAAKPAPDRWSVLECVEHVATVERRFISLLQNGKRQDSPAIDKEKEAALLARVTDRSQRANAPEPVQPTGRFTTLEEALAAFDSARAESMRFAVANHAELYSMQADHMRFGSLNGYEWMLIVAGHTRRQAAQIREARAALAGA